MDIPVQAQINSQAVEVLKFMARNVQARPMLHDLLMHDIHRWTEIPDGDKRTVFARDVRRFSAACPHLAKKDRISHALEALEWSQPLQSAQN